MSKNYVTLLSFKSGVNSLSLECGQCLVILMNKTVMKVAILDF